MVGNAENCVPCLPKLLKLKQTQTVTRDGMGDSQHPSWDAQDGRESAAGFEAGVGQYERFVLETLRMNLPFVPGLHGDAVWRLSSRRRTNAVAARVNKADVEGSGTS